MQQSQQRPTMSFTLIADQGLEKEWKRAEKLLHDNMT